jgi:hypothetical protein
VASEKKALGLVQRRRIALGTENQLRGGCTKVLPSHSNDLADLLATTAFPTVRGCTRQAAAAVRPPPLRCGDFRPPFHTASALRRFAFCALGARPLLWDSFMFVHCSTSSGLWLALLLLDEGSFEPITRWRKGPCDLLVWYGRLSWHATTHSSR